MNGTDPPGSNPDDRAAMVERLLQGRSLAIVTASSEQYAFLLFGLHDSLGPWRDHLHFMDIGVSEATRREITRRRIKPVSIPNELFEGVAFAAPYLRVVYSIAFLPQLVDADVILWIDADCWVQRLEAIEQFVRGAFAFPESFTICAMLDVDYRRCIDNYAAYQNMYRNVHEKLFGPEDTEFLYGKAIFTGGVHAASRSSPVWADWQQKMRALYTQNSHMRADVPLAHIAEQQALNLVLHRTGRFHVLTSEMNWHCHCSEVERGGTTVRIVPSGRVPAIVHLCEFGRLGDEYRRKRLLYEPAASS